MEEYRIEIKVKNNLIIKKIEEAGYKTIGEFCRLNDIMGKVGSIGDIINLKSSPLCADGKWKACILLISDILGCSPEDFFTHAQLNTILKSNKRSIKVNEAEMKFMLSQQPQHLLEELVEEDQKSKAVIEAVDTLNVREQHVVNLRYGLNGEDEHTLVQVAEIECLSTERIRQIEAKALRKLRHPQRHRNLKQFLNSEEGVA